MVIQRSPGSQLVVAALACRSRPVRGSRLWCRVEALEGELFRDDQVDAGQSAELGCHGLVVWSSLEARSRVKWLSARVICTVNRQRIAICPSAAAG